MGWLTSSKVVALPQAAARPEVLHQVLGQWQALRGGRLVPRRSEIDPRKLGQALPMSFLLERIAPGHARVRLAGSGLCAALGIDLKGLPFGCLFGAADREALGAALDETFTQPRGTELTLTLSGSRLSPATGAEMLLLPLRSDLGDVSRALGVVALQGSTERRLAPLPRRFAIARVKPLALVAAPSAPVQAQGGKPLLRVV